jgi:uncharacterized protein (DUF2147 family)
MHLKKILLTLTLIVSTLLNSSIASEYKASDIIGTWLSEKKDGVIKVSLNEGTFRGHLIAFKKDKVDLGKVSLDKNNPDEKLKTRKLRGIEMFWGFKFDDDEWSGGKIYDPISGKTYKSYMSLDGKDTLNLRGYVGIPLFGRTSVWTRIDQIPEFKE